nr:hypothetical protein [Thermococcus sp. Bubb.Bath]
MKEELERLKASGVWLSEELHERIFKEAGEL